MEVSFEEKIQQIKTWLGTGSINIFGLPMSGKDTVGIRLAEAIGGKFLSSGLIIRKMEEAQHHNLTGKGELIATDTFFDWVLPYFNRGDLKDYPLILSSIGRWHGEEETVIDRAKTSGHEIKAAVVLNISEADVMNRWEAAQMIQDRGKRIDDEKPEVFQKRLEEFRDKTRPVLLHYRDLGLLVEVRGDAERDAVFEELVNKLYYFSLIKY